MTTLGGRQPASLVKAPDGGKNIRTIAQNVRIWMAPMLIEPELSAVHIGRSRSY
jgi:hypothetical protein